MTTTDNTARVPVLELTTQVAPAPIFTVDGQEYELLGLEHLSAEDESHAAALFARFSRIARSLDVAENDQKAADLAKAMRKKRVEIISLLTTMPAALVAALKVEQQVQLLGAIQTEAGLAGE